MNIQEQIRKQLAMGGGETLVEALEAIVHNAIVNKECEIKEMIFELKYRGHDPQADCLCKICEICNELIDKINDK